MIWRAIPIRLKLGLVKSTSRSLTESVGEWVARWVASLSGTSWSPTRAIFRQGELSAIANNKTIRVVINR